MECLAELYIANRQPGQGSTVLSLITTIKRLPLIQDNNLYTDVRGQVLLLTEFDQELSEISGNLEKRRANLERAPWIADRPSTCWLISYKVSQ